jgi:hypothetical protein
VLLIRRIRDQLYEQGFTINGARHRLDTELVEPRAAARVTTSTTTVSVVPPAAPMSLRDELVRIRALLELPPDERV